MLGLKTSFADLEPPAARFLAVALIGDDVLQNGKTVYMSLCMLPLASPQILLIGPLTPLAGPQTPPADPQTSLTGPQTPPAGLQIALAGSGWGLRGQILSMPPVFLQMLPK